NPNSPKLDPVPANSRTQVIGNAAPNLATEVPLSELQTLELGLRLTEQIPTEVKPTIEREALGPIRGEQITAALPGPPLPSVTLLPAGIQPVAPEPAGRLDQLVSRTAAVNAAQAAEPPNTQQQIITPDNKQATTTIQQRQPPPLRITVSFPR